MAAKSNAQRRSGCPVSISLELLGDRWSLLIVRDMMVRGYSTFRQFQRSGEGIATNILTDRLHKLEAADILAPEPAAEDGRSTHYRLTEKGIALAPVLLELLIWSAHHEQTDAPCEVIRQMEKNRAAVLAETYRRWKERDPTPILPPFQKPSAPAHLQRRKQAKNSRQHPNSPKGRSKL